MFFQGAGSFFTLWNPDELYRDGRGLGERAGRLPQRSPTRPARGGRDERSAASPHIPVLLDEVLDALAPQPGDVIVDATFGAGGYTRAFLDAGATVHAFDRDPDAIAAGRELARNRARTRRGWCSIRGASRKWSPRSPRRASRGSTGWRWISASRRCSSTRPERGFAFSADGPLDMTHEPRGPDRRRFPQRRAPRPRSPTCCIHYGEERQSRRVARAIVAARPLATTGELAQVVRKALGYRAGAPKDPATRSFQAIRIHVNGELDELEQALARRRAAARRGRPAGGGQLPQPRGPHRQALPARGRRRRRRAPAATCPKRRRPPRRPSRSCRRPSARPTPRSLRNPRARSATLRAAVRTAAPAVRGEAA